MVSPSISVLQHTGRLEGVFGGLLPADLSVGFSLRRTAGSTLYAFLSCQDVFSMAQEPMVAQDGTPSRPSLEMEVLFTPLLLPNLDRPLRHIPSPLGAATCRAGFFRVPFSLGPALGGTVPWRTPPAALP